MSVGEALRSLGSLQLGRCSASERLSLISRIINSKTFWTKLHGLTGAAGVFGRASVASSPIEMGNV